MPIEEKKSPSSSSSSSVATQEETEEDLGLKELADIGNRWLKLGKTIREALGEIEEKKEKKEGRYIRGNDGV